MSEVTGDDLGQFKVVDETVFIAYIGPEDEAAAKAFAQVAAKHRDEFTFGLVSDTAAIQEQGLKSPTVVCYKQLDGDSKALPAFDDAESLDRLVLEESRPVVGELTPYNQQRFLEVCSLQKGEGPES